MQWFYAVNGQRFGPITPEDFARLVADGTVAADTLVWKEGMASWVAWGTIAAETPLPPVGDSTAPGLPAPAYDGSSAEETTGDVEDWTLGEFSARLNQNGFSFPVDGGLRRSWKNMTDGYGAALGACLVAAFLMLIAGLVPLLGLAASFVVTPQLTAGMAWYFLRRQRGEMPALDTIFDGYRRRFGGLALVAVVQVAAAIVIAIVVALVMAPLGFSFGHLSDSGSNGAPVIGLAAGVALFFLGLLIVVLGCRFLLVHVILMDQSMGVIDAFRLSWRITGKSFWSLLAIGIIVIVVNIIGAIPLFIGTLLLLPLGPAVLAQVYEEARLAAAGTPPSE